MISRNAALTIVSKNYFAFALTLAKSYKIYHPENDFIIVLVDRADGYLQDDLPQGVEVIGLADIAIPDVGRFIYRYSIMELNTAVKPFAMSDIMSSRGYETLLYIDPDIMIYSPLTAVYDALLDASIVLIPHIRKPYYDSHVPSDISILQSGTYNLGFLGVKNTKCANAMLDWWMTKLNLDCIVDIPNGLFVDQKWMDLIPGFFPDHAIVYHCGYNAAYWNLHERELTKENDIWLVDGELLAFFHFSGYVPYAPYSLSKHQNRHQLANLPEVKLLADEYANCLVENRYDESSHWPYAFATLSNGVEMPMQLVREVMQWAARSAIPTPCPITEPSAFCTFLLSKTIIPNRPKLVLLFHFLLKLRPDVAEAFPQARLDSSDIGFRNWLQSDGQRDYAIRDLMELENVDMVGDLVADVFQRLRQSGRQDVLVKREKMWAEPQFFDDFLQCLSAEGIKQLALTTFHISAIRRAVPAVGRILNIYFLRGDLQRNFHTLWEPSQVAAFCSWLRENRYGLNLEDDEISLFQEFANNSKMLVDSMRFLYLHKGETIKRSITIYAVDARRSEVMSGMSTVETLNYLLSEKVIDPSDHYFDQFGRGSPLADDVMRAEISGLDSRRNFAFANRVKRSIQARESIDCIVNLSGFLNAPSGMGESARSMAATLNASSIVHRQVTLPHPQAQYVTFPNTPAFLGWPATTPDISISVANADSNGLLKAFLPSSFWGVKNVGYWVWETEQLPRRFADSQKQFDELWTASAYSQAAILKTVSIPVRVLPHTLDFAALDGACANRARFRLPQNAVLFGFAFDPQSVLERKNISGLVKAFNRAFRPDDNCYLVLKVNGKTSGLYDYEMIRATARNDRILFQEGTLSRADTFDWMKSLDVYVSLHRAEGFGLTCAEAMALGIPVIASNYSGNLEFMDAQNSILIATKTLKTERAFGPYPAGTVWGEPDLDAAIDAMRNICDADRRIDIGTRGANSVRNKLSTERIGKIASGYIDALKNSI